MALTVGSRQSKRSFQQGKRLLEGLLFLGVMAGLVWSGIGISRRLRHSDTFRLYALEVEGLRLLSGAEILAASGLQLGDNIFAVDLREVQRRIEQHPWVKRAVVTRRPPDRLAIEIAERRRIAWIHLGEIYGIDAEGVLLPGEPRPGEATREFNLPVITGLNWSGSPPSVGTAIADSALGMVLRWWRQATMADAEFCLNISELQPLKGNGIRLLLVGDGLEVRLPADEVAERLRFLRKLIKRVYRECPEPAYIDLRFAGQVVVGSKERNS